MSNEASSRAPALGPQLGQQVLALRGLKDLDLQGCPWPLPAGFTVLRNLTRLHGPWGWHLEQGISALTGLQVGSTDLAIRLIWSRAAATCERTDRLRL